MIPSQTLLLSRHESYDSIAGLNSVHKSPTNFFANLAGNPITRLPNITIHRAHTDSSQDPATLISKPPTQTTTVELKHHRYHINTSNAEYNSASTTPIESAGSDRNSAEPFIQLEMQSFSHAFLDLFPRDFHSIIASANNGIGQGVKPSLADGAMGGTYFLRDEQSNVVIVCKPGDEEPNSPHNPYHVSNHPSGWGGWYKGRIMPGFGMYREVAAFVLDKGFAGVPPTQLARVRGDILSRVDAANSTHSTVATKDAAASAYKVCSVQYFVQNECSAEDMGAGRFSLEDVQRIAVLDIRLCNLDRHEGNLLVCETNPYQRVDACSALSRVTEEDDEDMFHCDVDIDTSMSDLTAACGSRSDMCSPGTSSRSTDMKCLVPIDHGYVLPHVLYMGDPSLSWMFWPQCDEPLCKAVCAHVEALDFERDAELLRRVVGAALPDTSLLTLRVCTAYLKKCTAAGLTLKEMASAMCVDESTLDADAYVKYTSRSVQAPDSPYVSTLQRAVHLAVHRSLCHCAACQATAAGRPLARSTSEAPWSYTRSSPQNQHHNYLTHQHSADYRDSNSNGAAQPRAMRCLLRSPSPVQSTQGVSPSSIASSLESTEREINSKSQSQMQPHAQSFKDDSDINRRISSTSPNSVPTGIFEPISMLVSSQGSAQSPSTLSVVENVTRSTVRVTEDQLAEAMSGSRLVHELDTVLDAVVAELLAARHLTRV